MSTDAYRDLLFNDGEGITHGDLNNARAFLGARLFDQIMEHHAGASAVLTTDPDLWSEQGEDTDLTSLIYTLTGGDGVLKQGSSATKIGTYGGTIFQKIATADGEEASFIPYTLGENEFDLTIGAGHATLKRIDIVQVKLEYVEGDSESRDYKDAITGALTTTTPDKTRRVQATISLKAGTAATPPTYPDPDAGYAVLGAVLVPATWTTGITAEGWPSEAGKASMRQCSIPLRTHSVTVGAAEADDSGAGGAGTYDRTNNYAVATGGDVSNVLFWCPVGSPGTRVVGVTLHGAFITGGGLCAAKLFSYRPFDGGGSFSLDAPVICTLTSALITTDAAAHAKSQYAHMGQIADGMADSNPSAANGPIGDGVWCGGGRSGPATAPIKKHAGVSASDVCWLSQVALQVYLEADSWIFGVTFHLAG